MVLPRTDIPRDIVPLRLVISIPLSYFAGIGAASRHGILFKGGNWLDAVTHIDTVVFDKTGTLTRGVFSVTKVCGNDTGKLLATVAAMERSSNHPIAKAITPMQATGRLR